MLKKEDNKNGSQHNKKVEEKTKKLIQHCHQSPKYPQLENENVGSSRYFG